MTDVVEIGSLPTRNPVAGTSCADRLDPYFGGLWETGAAAAWSTRERAVAQVEAGVLSGGMWARPTGRDAALEAVTRSKARLVGLPALAATNLWRTMTGQQLAAMTGVTGLARYRSPDLHRLWSAGLVEVGRMASLSRTNQMPLLVRPSVRGDWAQLYDRLTFDEWVGVTAGQPWRWGSQFDRHNVLTVELALRVAELTSVPLVLGEQLCALHAMAVPGLQVGPKRSTLAADAMLVRGDGLKIMVELTVSTHGLADKVARWADLLAADRTGQLAVVFVLAPHPDRPAGRGLQQVSNTVAQASRASITQVLGNVPARMMVTTWRHWFPAAAMVSDDFLALRASRPSGNGQGADRWERVGMLDPFELPGPQGDGRQVLDNAAWLYGVPHWMRPPRDETATQAWARVNGVERFPRQQGMPLPPQERARRRNEQLDSLWA